MPSPKLTRQRRPRGIREQALGPWVQGVNEKAEPHALEFSELSDSGNIIVDERTGRATQRPGNKFIVNIALLNRPVTKCHNFIKRDGTEIALITDGEILVTTQDFVVFIDITPAAFLVGGEFAGDPFFIDFTTVDDRVLITNGVDPVFSFDGVIAGTPSESLVAYDRGTSEITIDGGDSTTSLVDALLNRSGDGTTWVGQLIVVTSGGDDRLGEIRKILTFDDDTDTITFDAIPGLTTGDKVKVGVAIPRGRYGIHHFNITFLATTPENQSEFRFNDDTDPNEPSITINFDNPNAWPAQRQIDIGGGDRIWGFSHPIYRNRFCVMKSSGLIRIEPDPVFIFRPVFFETQFGSRFPDTWQQQNNVLVFLGQDKDGLPDVFMTDFVTTRHFNRKHFRTLDNLQQPNSIFRSRIINSKSQFDSGLKSSYITTENASVKVDDKVTQSEYEAILESGLNIDLETTPGKVSVIGKPADWSERYEANALPQNSSPAWTVTNDPFPVQISNGGFATITAGVLRLGVVGGGSINQATYQRTGIFSSSNDSYCMVRVGMSNIDNCTAHFGIMDGSRGIAVEVTRNLLSTDIVKVNGVVVASISDAASQNLFAMLIKPNNTYKIWMNGNLIASGSTGSASLNRIYMSAGALIGSNPLAVGGVAALNFQSAREIDFDFFYHHTNYKGDKLSGQDGKVLPVTLPDTFPVSGNIVFNNDYAKPIHNNPGLYSFGRTHFKSDITGGTLIAESRSSDDNVAFPDAYVAFVTGAVPSSAVRQFLQTRFTIGNSLTTALSGVFSGIKSGSLYLTPPLLIGAEIKAWDIQQISRVFDSGAFGPKIRRATSVSLAAASLITPELATENGWVIDVGGAQGNVTDAEGWFAIANGSNIGSVIGGVDDVPNPPDPATLYVQLQFQMDVAVFDDNNEIISIIENWREGAAKALPTSAIMYKKRWLLTAASIISSFNDVVITLDSNRGFNNWNGFNVNCFMLYRGKLLTFDSDSKDVIEVVDGLLSDDDGDDGSGGRKSKAIFSFVISRDDIGGAIHERKKARYFETIGTPIDGTVTFSAKRETESNFKVIGTTTFSPTVGYKRLHFKTGFTYRRLALKAENNNLNEGLGVNGFILGYERVPGRGHR